MKQSLKEFFVGAWEDAVMFGRLAMLFAVHFGHWAKALWRLVRKIYHRFTRFLQHFVVVERRFRGVLPRVIYPFRLLRYIVHHYHLLPSWFKFAKILVVLFFVLSPYALQYMEKWQKQRVIYDKYFPHFYEEYAKVMPDYEARYYADFYASYFSEYYSSENYKRALQFALPAATPETITYPEDSRVAEMVTDDAGIELIKEFEGLVRKPYLDVGGKLTIGYGHLIRPGEFYEDITEEEAEELLRQDIKVAEAVVKRNVTVKLNQQQFSALVSLVYNIGSGHFEDSTMLRKLNRGNFSGAGQEFLRWDHVGRQKVNGLTRRRIAERVLFLKG